MVIVNGLTKYLYIILFKKKYIAKQLATIILSKLIQYYRISKKITNNKINSFYLTTSRY